VERLWAEREIEVCEKERERGEGGYLFRRLRMMHLAPKLLLLWLRLGKGRRKSEWGGRLSKAGSFFFGVDDI
jgi:hypothetical protein